MEIILIIIIIILLFPFLSAAGWAMKGAEAVFDVMWDGFSNFCGCSFKVILWILGIALLIYLFI